MEVYDRKAELANALTHGIGAVCFIAISPVLLFMPLKNNEMSVMWVNAGYICCLLITYISSTIYHAVTDPFFKKSMRVMDHISIFLLIGGTFTPLAFRYMTGQIFLMIFWLFILAGILFKVFFTGRFRFLSTFFYLAIAWIAAMFSGEMFRNMPESSFHYLMAGGIAYSAGTIFYMWKKLRFHHAIWHLFVLAGSGCHFAAIYLAVR